MSSALTNLRKVIYFVVNSFPDGASRLISVTFLPTQPSNHDHPNTKMELEIHNLELRLFQQQEKTIGRALSNV